MKNTNKKKLKKKIIREIMECPFTLDYNQLHKQLLEETYNDRKMVNEIIEECKSNIEF